MPWFMLHLKKTENTPPFWVTSASGRVASEHTRKQKAVTHCRDDSRLSFCARRRTDRMKHLFLKSLKCLKIDSNCGINRNQNWISRSKSGAGRCCRRHSPTPEKTRYEQDGASLVENCTPAITSIIVITLQSFRGSSLSCSFSIP